MTTTDIAPSQPTVELSRPYIWDHDLRNQELPVIADVVENLIAVGANVLYSPPGLGKTWLALVVEHHLAYPESPQMGNWERPTEPERCLIYDGESDKQMVQERSFSVTRRIPTDGDEGLPAGDDWGGGGIKHMMEDEIRIGLAGRTPIERFLMLRTELAEAREAGHPFRYVRIDTMKMFIGPPDRGSNAAEHENKWMVSLNRLAYEYDCGIVLLHHSNKADTVSGSTGIAGGVTNVIRMTRNPENEHEILITSEKTRRSSAFEYAVIQNEDGVPRFTDSLTSTQASQAGLNRQVINVLTRKGPRTMSELCRDLYDLPRETVRSSVKRMQRKHILRYFHGAYEILPVNVPEGLFGPAPELHFCTVCTDRMIAFKQGQTTHPGCSPQQPAAGDVVDQGDEDAPVVVDGWDADAALMRSILRSKLHPIPSMWEQRDEEPFTRITEQLDGQHHQWNPKRDVPDGQTVSILDRRKSYLATAGDVHVAPNRLAHTGPLDLADGTDRTERPIKLTPRRADGTPLAGIAVIAPVQWDHLDKIAHPLGWSAGNGVDPVPITWPHLQLLVKLWNRGELAEMPQVLDSWTGRAATNLFRPFAEEAKQVLENRRLDADDTDLKIGYGKAIRKLWPKTVFSKTFRPDWHQAWEAEAAVRNWAVAWVAIKNETEGNTLVRIANVDATHWLSPGDADTTWAPSNYTVGRSFGHVKHKDDCKLKVIDPATGKFARDASGAVITETVSSPLTAEQYARRS